MKEEYPDIEIESRLGGTGKGLQRSAPCRGRCWGCAAVGATPACPRCSAGCQPCLWVGMSLCKPCCEAGGDVPRLPERCVLQGLPLTEVLGSAETLEPGGL